jgi:hypothetical protein
MNAEIIKALNEIVFILEMRKKTYETIRDDCIVKKEHVSAGAWDMQAAGVAASIMIVKRELKNYEEHKN